MKIIVWNSQDKCVADYHKLIRGCDVLCLLDCGQWTGQRIFRVGKLSFKRIA